MIRQPDRDNYCLDHKQKIVWIRVPKVASTSIRNAWRDNLAPNRQFAEAKHHDHYFTIMFVRDPIDRFLSAWRGNWKNTTYSPDELALKVMELEPHEVNRHLRPQWTFSQGLTVDFLGRLETIHEDWEKLQQRYNFRDLPHKNVSKKPGQLSPHIEQKLREYYLKDYDLYYR